MNIAIFSPNRIVYSETFIGAHKNYLNGPVFFYHGIEGNIKLENHKDRISSFKRLWIKIYGKIRGKSTSYFWEQAVLRSLIAKNIDVILVEYGSHAYHLKTVLKNANIPVVVHFHGYDASIDQVIKGCNSYIDVFEIANKVIVVSKVMNAKLLKLGCPKEKLIYNVYGPSPEFGKVTPLYNKKQFISVGRFVDKKAPYHSILAFKEVLKTHPDACLIMAGDGPLFNTSQNIIKHYNLNDNVKLVGVISPEEYRQFLSESLAFVQHSVTAHNGDMEGTPLAILEASIAGLPVIATNHGGIPDVIIHGETGLLCEEHDVESMTQNMLQILDNNPLARTMGSRGRQHISAHFNLSRHIESLNSTLEK